jgi:hypothetical protein
MTISMYQASVPVLLRQLANLSAILAKGEAHAAASHIDPAAMLAARLAPDMFPLIRQVQSASDGAKGGAARLAGIEPPSFPDDEVTFADLQARIARTVAFLETITPAQVDGGEDRAITLQAGPREFHFTGQNFLLQFVLPNVFFHCTTAYALLRHQGVPIGKIDYLGGV